MAAKTSPAANDARRSDFAGVSRLLTVMFAFTAVSLVAEAYVPLKQLVAGAGDFAAVSAGVERLTPLLPALLLLGALREGRLLFAGLESGALLAAATALHLRRCGEWIVAAAVSALAIGEILAGSQAGWALLAGLGAIGLALRSLAGVLEHAATVQADLDQIV
jgi:hypothetical protein